MFLRKISRAFPSAIKTYILTSAEDSSGKLKKILEVFSSNNINLTHIESHPASSIDCTQGNSFIIDFESTSDQNTNYVISELKAQGVEAVEAECKEVPWFPKTMADLDTLDQKTLASGAELESDHPGFTDEAYKKRRHQIAEIAFSYKCSDGKVPKVEYNSQELKTWETIFDILNPLHQKHACKEYLNSVEEMNKHCGYKRNNIPQIQDINEYLMEQTGFRMKPVAGLLSARDFLNFLAFRVFASTQYIRHHSVPMYTPEPDIVHELIGHAPLFANKAFADFSQEIGLASLGASEKDIKRIATCYWFSVEFGLIKEISGEKKLYGAGTLSSANEIMNAMSDKPLFRFFNPEDACDVEYPICSLQPIYFWSRTFEEAKKMMRKYAVVLNKGFETSYDKEKKEIKVYQNIKTSKNLANNSVV